MCWYSVYKCIACISNPRRGFVVFYNVAGRQKVADLHLNSAHQSSHRFTDTQSRVETWPSSLQIKLWLEFMFFVYCWWWVIGFGGYNTLHTIWLGSSPTAQAHVFISALNPTNSILLQTHRYRIWSQLTLLRLIWAISYGYRLLAHLMLTLPTYRQLSHPIRNRAWDHVTYSELSSPQWSEHLSARREATAIGPQVCIAWTHKRYKKLYKWWASRGELQKCYCGISKRFQFHPECAGEIIHHLLGLFD